MVFPTNQVNIALCYFISAYEKWCHKYKAKHTCFSEETFFTSEPDVWKLSVNELLNSKNATVNCKAGVGINYINWLSNKTELPLLRQRNDEEMLYKDVESVQVTIEIPLKEWKTSSTQFCNQEFYNTTGEDF